MSIHGPVSPDGAETVGWLERLPPTGVLVVWSVRRWLDGPEAQAEVWNAFATALGAERGRCALRAFEAYLGAIATAATRRLCRHAASCPCVGRDEADLAAIVSLAGRGEMAGAAEHAARIVPPERLPAVLMAATELARLVAGCDVPRKEGSARRNAGFRRLH